MLADPPPRIVLDLGGVTFCDSQGLGTLVVLSRKASHAQSLLMLTNVGDFLIRVLDITGPPQRPDDPQRPAHRLSRPAASGGVAPAGLFEQPTARSRTSGSSERSRAVASSTASVSRRHCVSRSRTRSDWAASCRVFTHNSTKTDTLARSTHGSNGLVR